MKVKIKFWILISVFTVLGLLDLSLRYLIEDTILVTQFGVSGGGIIYLTFTLLVYIFLAYITFFKYKRVSVSCKNFREFLSKLFYDLPYVSLRHFIFTAKPCKSYAWVGALGFYMLAIGFFITYLTAITRRIIFLHTYGLGARNWPYGTSTLRDGYILFRQLIPTSQAAGFIILIIIALTFFYWFYKEYRINTKTFHKRDTREES